APARGRGAHAAGRAEPPVGGAGQPGGPRVAPGGPRADAGAGLGLAVHRHQRHHRGGRPAPLQGPPQPLPPPAQRPGRPAAQPAPAGDPGVHGRHFPRAGLQVVRLGGLTGKSVRARSASKGRPCSRCELGPASFARGFCRLARAEHEMSDRVATALSPVKVEAAAGNGQGALPLVYPTTRGHCRPFGATPRPGGVNFAVFSRHAHAVTLVIFKEGQEAPLAEIPLDPAFNRTGDVWHIFVYGLGPEVLYGYRVHGPFDPKAGHRFNPWAVLLDPYAVTLSGGHPRGPPAAEAAARGPAPRGPPRRARPGP